MTPSEKYIFDLNGYIVLRGILTSDEVKEANLAIDNHLHEVHERTDPAVRNTVKDSGMAGDGKNGRKDLGGVLGWNDVDSKVFRSILAHPKLIPYFHTLVGRGYRMDHQPFAILQDRGSEGFALHGGMVDVASGQYNPFLAYSCVNGMINNCLLACSVILSDHNAGDGGFCVVPGSHKANFPAPMEMINGDNYREFVRQPETKAGDVVLFSEATVHGALPWNADHQRRICLYRFAPPTMAYGRSYLPDGMSNAAYWPENFTKGMTEAQLAVMAPPYAIRLDRHVLNTPANTNDDKDGESKINSQVQVVTESRSAAKKAFDKAVFKTDYF